MSEPADDPREPCRWCGQAVRVGARKCPHCKEYLDAQLARDREQQATDALRDGIETAEIRQRVRDNVIAAGIGALVFSCVGLVAGPATIGLALYYHHRAKVLQMGWPRGLRLLYAFGALWTATGTIFLVVWLLWGQPF